MTKITIDQKRRTEIKNIVLDTLGNVKLFSLPVDIKKICKSFCNIRLIPFSVHMKRRGLTFEQMVNYCESKDACVDYYASHDSYIIYYNDVEFYRTVNSNRYRWSIAHELGHVLLSHHKRYIKTRIFRSQLNDYEYNYLEAEADYFAQLMLVPHAALVGFKISKPSNIRVLCKISDPASKRRFNDYIEWRTTLNANDEYDNAIFHYYYSFVFQRKCKNCGTGVIQYKGKYCPICGEKYTLEWGNGDKMKYNLLETHENGKLKECPFCHNEETDIDGEYCQICGRYLINKCTNNNCPNTEILPTNARYCPICGERSTFLKTGFLKAWDFEYNTTGFMNIPDGIDEELPFS